LLNFICTFLRNLVSCSYFWSTSFVHFIRFFLVHLFDFICTSRLFLLGAFVQFHLYISSNFFGTLVRFHWYISSICLFLFGTFARLHLYISSISFWYISATRYRLSFKVGPNSPPGMENSFGKTMNLRTHSTWK